MKTKIIFAALFLTACSSFKPNEDRTPIPSRNSVYTLESSVCDTMFIGTAGCILTSNDDLSKKSIKVVIPFTNNKGVTSTLQLSSKECRVDVATQVKPGTTVTFTLKNLLKISRLERPCSIQIVLVPKWQDQEKYTLPVYPFLGRVILMVGNNPATTLSSPQSYLTYKGGYVKILRRSDSLTGAATASDSFISSIKINTGGSKAGRIVFAGCGMDGMALDYRTANPTIKIPAVSKSCNFSGSVLRLDQRGDLSFGGSIDVLPPRYLLLAIPNAKKLSNGSVEFQFDPTVSAFNEGGQLYEGNKFTASKEKVTGSHYLRAMTINGRYMVVYVVNGVVKWILQ